MNRNFVYAGRVLNKRTMCIGDNPSPRFSCFVFISISTFIPFERELKKFQLSSRSCTKPRNFPSFHLINFFWTNKEKWKNKLICFTLSEQNFHCSVLLKSSDFRQPCMILQSSAQTTFSILCALKPSPNSKQAEKA